MSTDVLLGVKSVKKKKATQPDNRLHRRFQQIEKLPAKDKRQLTHIMDTFIKASQVQQSA